MLFDGFLVVAGAKLFLVVCVVAHVALNRSAASVLVEPCCPALLNCIDVDVHTVVLLGK